MDYGYHPNSLFVHALKLKQAFHKGKCIGTVVCKMGEHRNTFRGYTAMLVVIKPYRGRGIGIFFVLPLNLLNGFDFFDSKLKKIVYHMGFLSTVHASMDM